MGRRAFSVSAYVVAERGILLVNHVKQQAWVPIGGELETGETPLEALVREVDEEIGWKLDEDYTLPQLEGDLEPPGFFTYEEHEAGPKGTHLNFAFLLKGKSRNLRPCAEFTEHMWVTKSFGNPPTIIEPTPPNVRKILERIFYGRNFLHVHG